MCVYSNSRNDVPRVAQRYGTIAAHTRRRASVLVVFVVFCVHMHSFAGLIRRTPPPTFSDTAITDRHSDATIFQLRAHWVRISWSIGSEKSFGHVPPVGFEPSTPCMQGESGSFRSYSRSVRSFRPGSFRPDFWGESFRPNWGGSFRPNFKGGSFRPYLRGESFRPDLFISGTQVR